jgi:phosphonate transport system substrate-binding protein
MPLRRTLLATAAGFTLAAPALAQPRRRLRIGVAPFLPTQQDTLRAWRPLYEHVARELGFDFDLQVASDWAGISTALIAGQLDLAQMGPWGYVLAHARSNARIIASEITNDRDTYHAIVVGRPGLSVPSWPDAARGMSISFTDTGSFSGWVVPQYWLRRRGIDPRTFFGRYAEGVAPAAIQVSVAQGLTDLGTGWDTQRQQMILQGSLRADANQVIWQSDPLPNGGLVVRPGFDQGVVPDLQAVLVATRGRNLMPAPYDGWIRADHDRYAFIVDMARFLNLLPRA